MKTLAVLNTCCLLAAALLPSWAAAQAATEPAWVAEARQVAAAMPPRLLAVLQEELDRSGPEGAIAVCNEKAPQMAREASEKSGWAIRRVSLRNRNPKAVPDAWEQTALQEFDRRLAAQEPASRLEKSEVTQEGGKSVQRYIRALPTAKLCLECHGSAEQISPAVAARLKALYPADLATGYSVGQLRGAITLRKAVP